MTTVYTAALEPAVNGKQVHPGIVRQGLPRRPSGQDDLQRILMGHADDIMTIRVIRQPPKTVIDRGLLTDHHGSMVRVKDQSQEKLLSPGRLEEMRPEKIGARLRLLRLALGLTPAEMSDSMGMLRTYWTRFEKGHRSITPTFAAAVAERYGVTLDFILVGDRSGLPLRLAEQMRQVERSDQNN